MSVGEGHPGAAVTPKTGEAHRGPAGQTTENGASVEGEPPSHSTSIMAPLLRGQVGTGAVTESSCP